MKTLSAITLLVLMIRCTPAPNPDHQEQVAPTIDFVPQADSVQSLEPEYDTLTLTSLPFALNRMSCYWKHSFVIYDYGLEVNMELLEKSSNRLLVEYADNPRYAENYNYKSSSYFDEINIKLLKDVNFDGLKDFVIYSEGSMAMTSLTNIYLFDKKTKTFIRGEENDLSDISIEEIDSLNRILTTSSFDREREYKTLYHFDRSGNIKFTEHLSEETYSPNDTLDFTIKSYSKVVKGKEVASNVDTVKLE